MAELSRDRAAHLRSAGARAAGLAWLGLACLAASAPSDPFSSEQLLGTWHVLVHYRDENAADKQALRWDDRIWIFERAGSGLRWREYPIVVFRDQTGRFESLGTNRQSRVVHAWEPNAEQLEQIRSGLEVNSRGMKSKTLRGSDAESWRSQDRAQAASASIISYVETWSIESLAALPVFTRLDVLGSAETEGLEGVTRYTATAVEQEGAVIRGSYERDGTRRGTFRMQRAGEVRGVKGKSEEERREDRRKSLEELLR
jgi:hypothetical protein